MPVPTHFRFTFRGVYSGTPETFSFGIKMEREVDVGPDATLDDVDMTAVGAAAVAFFSTAASGVTTTAKLTDVRGYVIGTNGLMEGNPEILDVSALDGNGATTNKYPPQIALVMTHVGPNRGPGRYGRVFLPTAIGIGSDMLVSSATAIAAREAYTTFVKAVSDAIDLPGTIASSAQLNISDSGVAGVKQAVDHHEVGLALDTLRSRRRALVEDRQAGGHIDW